MTTSPDDAAGAGGASAVTAPLPVIPAQRAGEPLPLPRRRRARHRKPAPPTREADLPDEGTLDRLLGGLRRI
jgi:hypothetical protein